MLTVHIGAGLREIALHVDMLGSLAWACVSLLCAGLITP